jgi:EAL domain-containing protein (putative c-di-GMP-specific phosphodiesterase class I)
VRAIRQACNDLGIDVIAEGVETLEEYYWFEDEGVTLFQGYLFARPGFEALPSPSFPSARPMIRVL